MNKLRIRKIGVLSVAKLNALIAFVFSLLLAIPYGLIIMIFGATAFGTGESGGMLAGGGAIIFGILIMIGLPILYAIIGFVGGAIGALLYNLFAGIIGGIEIEVESVR